MRPILRNLGLAVYGGDEIVLATLCCAAAAWGLGTLVHPWAALAAVPPWAVVIYFFRDPKRQVPPGGDLLIAPADGTVMDIEEVDEPEFIGRRALRIGIFLSPLNVHVNRMPCEGTVGYRRFKAGEFLPAYNPQAPMRNESQEVGLLRRDQVRVLVKQITGVVARRIVCEAEPGSFYRAGERFGMIKFGSRTELYVPADLEFQVEAQLGQKVAGGETILISRLRAPDPSPVQASQETLVPNGGNA